MKKILLAVFIAHISMAAHAEFYNGNRLIRYYAEHIKTISGDRTADYVNAGAYMAYVAGVTDTLVSRQMICPPTRIYISQVADIVGKYLNAHREQLHYAGDRLVFMALEHHFPC